ncbi:MAG: hypothetical protein ACM3VT_02980 [Solirubrobacterales bacterium]
MHARSLVVLAALVVAACSWRTLPAEESPSQTVSPQSNEPNEPNGFSGTPEPLEPNEPNEPNEPGSAKSGRSGLTGYVAAEGRLFFHDPLYPGQEDNNGSLAAQPEYYYQWENGNLFTFTPFGRVDSADSERTHWDIRELYYLYTKDWWSFRAGVARVFWGATEFVHLVDVINQTDFVEHIDGEDKLGQPMLQFSSSVSWGSVDVFILPYFRERTFPGREGRLRPELLIDTDDAVYENPDKERAKDLCIRYSKTFGDIDWGAYFFWGTNRDPLLVPSTYLDPNDTGELRLIPFYERVHQFGTDLQWANGNWLWKLEALYRSGYLDPYVAATGGLEYTFFGLGGGKGDVGIVAEYAYDERGDDPETTSIFDNDVFLGLRLTPNDVDGTQILVGGMQDVEQAENAVIVEASRRFGSHWRLSLDAWFFLDTPEDSVIYYYRADDFARLELAYYF